MKTVLILYQEEFGGTNVLLIRLANWLSAHGYSVIEANDFRVKVDFLIMPTSEMGRVFSLVMRGLRFRQAIIWCMGHGAFKAAFFNEKLRQSRLRYAALALDSVCDGFLKVFSKDRAVLFTDYVGLNSDMGNIGGFDKYTDFVMPIAVDYPRESPVFRGDTPASYRLGWLGRLDSDFKYRALLKLLSDVDVGHIDGRLRVDNFFIIGSGDSELLIDEFIKGLSYKVTRVKHVDLLKLEDFLRENIDIMFAMGTSVLESAKIGIPSVVVQPCRIFEAPLDSCYRWVYESVGYSLGEFQSADCRPQQPSSNYDTIVKNISDIDYEFHSFSSAKFVEAFFPALSFSKFDDLYGVPRKRNYYFKVLWCFFIIFLFSKIKRTIKRVIRAF